MTNYIIKEKNSNSIELSKLQESKEQLGKKSKNRRKQK